MPSPLLYFLCVRISWPRVKLLLGVVGPVVPNVVGKVAAEEASHLFRSRILPIEEPTGGEVVGISPDLELLVGSEMLFWIILYVLHALEDVLDDAVLLQS
jgi:hypothetical protein